MKNKNKEEGTEHYEEQKPEECKFLPQRFPAIAHY
jgi:hypothetical protein